MDPACIKYPEVKALLGYFVLGTLAAFGAVCALWAVFGWLLPDGAGCALVCWGEPDDGILARVKWLQAMGLLRAPLLAVAEDGAFFCPGAEICSGEELLPRLEWERKRVNGTGDGDHSGRGQRGDLSEL